MAEKLSYTSLTPRERFVLLVMEISDASRLATRKERRAVRKQITPLVIATADDSFKLNTIEKINDARTAWVYSVLTRRNKLKVHGELFKAHLKKEFHLR